MTHRSGRLAVLVGAALSMAGCLRDPHGEDPHWDYEGRGAPRAWGSLSASYERCASGHVQSPVNLDLKHIDSTWPTQLTIRYGTTHATEENNGHTIEDKVDKGDFVELDGTRFDLERFHFHHPSEHTLNDVHYPLEIHFVHRSPAGALLVIAVVITEGEEHPVLGVLFDRLPRGQEKRRFDLDPAALLPDETDYIRYEGSLTTPPCTEGVTWIVLTRPLQAAPEQIRAFAALFPHNNRPLMPLNGRHLRAVKGP